jgi:carboxymethylenebutenolidase
MTGSFITVTAADGGKFQAYLATPAKGSGPGIVLLQEIFGVNHHIQAVADYYAEEGYVVLAPDLFWRLQPRVDLGYSGPDYEQARALAQRFDGTLAVSDIALTVKALRARPECTGKVGALGFCLGGRLAYLAAARAGVDCAVGYYGGNIDQHLDEVIKVPLQLHFAGADAHISEASVAKIRAAFAGREEIEIFVYPGVGHGFNCSERSSYDKPAALMAHSRAIALFHRAMGPRFDLSQLWDKHCEYEFGTRNVADTMGTMVASPYVNHIPTMTGGVGYDQLARFYENHFIPKTPKDTTLIPISRTIGADRVVDEMLFCFTHDIEIDWMLPGVKPTGKAVKIPLVAIICFRGDKLYNEHIYWDQASVLVQIGLLDPKLYPVAGVETANKLVDESLPSNTMMKRWAESEGRPIPGR